MTAVCSSSDGPPLAHSFHDLLQELLGRARRRGWRINLRPLGDVRNMLWLPIAWVLAVHSTRFLLWFASALAGGAGTASGGGGGARLQHQHQRY